MWFLMDSISASLTKEFNIFLRFSCSCLEKGRVSDKNSENGKVLGDKMVEGDIGALILGRCETGFFCVYMLINLIIVSRSAQFLRNNGSSINEDLWEVSTVKSSISSLSEYSWGFNQRYMRDFGSGLIAFRINLLACWLFQIILSCGIFLL